MHSFIITPLLLLRYCIFIQNIIYCPYQPLVTMPIKYIYFTTTLLNPIHSPLLRPPSLHSSIGPTPQNSPPLSITSLPSLPFLLLHSRHIIKTDQPNRLLLLLSLHLTYMSLGVMHHIALICPLSSLFKTMSLKVETFPNHCAEC